MDLKKKKSNAGLWVLGILGLLLLVAGLAGLAGYINSAKNAQVQVVSPGGATQGPDSSCPAGAPTIVLTGTNVGSHDWFNSIPKETPQGTKICVNTLDYRAFLLSTGTYQGKPFDQQKMSGWDVLAHHFSYDSVGNDSRFDELKKALLNVSYKVGPDGQPLRSTVWINLPGYKQAAGSAPQPICPSGECFKPSFVPMQPDATRTPVPTASAIPTAQIQLQYVPTDVPVTPMPQVTAAGISPEQVLQDQGYFRVYESKRCKVVQAIDIRLLSSNAIWGQNYELSLEHGELGWYAFGLRADVPVQNYGLYTVYNFCGQLINMPLTNVDGKGTSCQYCAVARIIPPSGTPDANGLINVGGTYWVNLYGVWYAPASVSSAPPIPTATSWPTPTPVPAAQFLTVDQAIRMNTSMFVSWDSVNPGAFPTAANPKIWMTSYKGTYLVDFSRYVNNMGSSGHAVMIDNCGTPVMTTYHGFVIATDQALNVKWCILPGK